MVVLLHEYAHHFAIATSSFAMPRRLSEGTAEFFASAKFDPDGTMWLGRPADHRGPELFYARDVKVRDLLDPAEYERKNGQRQGYDAFYGKSWLLYHYLVFAPERQGQMSAYTLAMTRGRSSPVAATEAFGDLDKIESEVDSYLMKRQMLAFKLPADRLQPGSATLRPLRPGEAEIMPVRIRSKRGVNDEQAAALVIEAQAIAARYPGDPAVLSALAEAEFDAGNDTAAIAAADAAIALDPAAVEALVQKGYALLRMAKDADDAPAAYKRARAVFLALNRVENDHPLSLWYYYHTFSAGGQKPPPSAVAGLQRAVELAPYDTGMRMTLATHLIGERRFDEARRQLTPIAYDPHGSGPAKAAQRLLDKITADPAWNGADIASVIAGSEAEEPAAASPMLARPRLNPGATPAAR